jgi:carbon-monoxide dehydrogenase medium subunit
MIAHEFDYTAPTQLKEALALLADGAKPLAGGMSLVPMMKLRLAVPEHVVDIRRIKELNYVKVSPEGIRLGATLSHHQVESSEIIRGVCPLLSKAAASIGDVQVRNMGTLGGSVAHADPAADYLAALFALEAQVKLTSSSGERIVAIREFVTDPFTTSIEPGELLTEIIVPAERPGTGTAYVKMAQPASGFALVGVAVRIGKSAQGAIDLARVGITGVGPTAYRANAVESSLTGTTGSAESIQAAAAHATDGIDVGADLNASAEYRKHLATVQTARAIRAALA